MIEPDDVRAVKEARDMINECMAAAERGDNAKAGLLHQMVLRKLLALRQKWTGVLEA